VGLVLVALAALATWWATKRSLGAGFLAVMAVGYAYGIVRANLPDGITHFLFDVSLGTFYFAEFQRPTETSETGQELRAWVTTLVVISVLAIPIGLIMGGQPVLVQLVGVRSTVFFLPLVLVGNRAKVEDLVLLARGIIALNLVALAFGLAEYVLGVERFYPLSSVTEVLYRSNDVAGGFLRIPGVFISPHAFGGVLAATSTLTLWRVVEAERKVERLYAGAGLLACAIAPFLCGARQPVIFLGILVLIMFAGRRLDPRVIVPALIASLIVGYFVLANERLQRVATLQRLDIVEHRIGGSVNASLVDILLEHPLGAGLASAVGTSIPFFLQADAVPQIGAENEYARLLLELGVHGLIVWLFYLRWSLLAKRPRAPTLLDRGAWGIALVSWSTAFIGTGILTSIPTTALLMFVTGWYVDSDARQELLARKEAEAA
jgi:hypothetical protein